MPSRIQRRRTKGFRLHENARSVTRGSRWGNPFRIGDPHPETGEPMDRASVVEVFRTYALGRLLTDPHWLDPLKGKDLACYCPLDATCHADVLLDLAERWDAWHMSVLPVSLFPWRPYRHIPDPAPDA